MAGDWLQYLGWDNRAETADTLPLLFPARRVDVRDSVPSLFKRRAAVKAPARGASSRAATAEASRAGGNGPGKPSVQRWAATVKPLAAQYGVPMDVALGVMDIESGGNEQARSPAGAMSLMQVMPFHFGPGENGMDPETNIRKGLQILARNFAVYGNWDSAAAAYFGAVDRQGRPTTARDVGGVSGIEYVKRFNEARGRYANPWP